jgi:hypothetical protein
MIPEYTLSEEQLKELEREGYTFIKYIPTKGYCGLRRFLFTTGLCIGMDEASFVGRYCYEHMADAKEALEKWDGEGDPSGDWIKYKGHPEERSRIPQL